ncbi:MULTISPECIES: hypothetical protein [Streptomyces]|uniref:DUF1579 domain-containing protein n=1 Tax=Streptomyces spinosisporus TaxID=2927582 RepID=A0ABS9XD48_9ACTN|nr:MULTISPECIES: hypothetical protein [Streptomyces]MCI3240004.1 hypothetical protein [Streptomyces spinosisporus]WUB38667.1 hypothetical protein OHN38_28575 [Streptomyces sp. NBC_00588]
MDATERQAALDRLNVLVGEWVVEAEFDGLEVPPGRSVFEWSLDGQFLVQRAQAPNPAPDAMTIIAVDPETGGYTQHYYDSRGVVRLYAMTFDDGVWQLLREKPDFSPLHFRQRYVGHLSADGDTIRGAWETAADETAPYEQDFVLTYRRRR